MNMMGMHVGWIIGIEDEDSDTHSSLSSSRSLFITFFEINNIKSLRDESQTECTIFEEKYCKVNSPQNWEISALTRKQRTIINASMEEGWCSDPSVRMVALHQHREWRWTIAYLFYTAIGLLQSFLQFSG